jgi:acyl-CoA thioester hydrolase
MRLEDFRHSISISPRFTDIDLMGHVNNATYLTYLEEARLYYAHDVFRGGIKAESPGMIMVKASIDYLLPIYLGDPIHIYTRCSRFGRKSFDLSYVIVKEADERLLSVATTTLVAYDYSRLKSVIIPAEWRERVTAYEKTQPVGE